MTGILEMSQHHSKVFQQFSVDLHVMSLKMLEDVRITF